MLNKHARFRCIFPGYFNLDMNLAEVNSSVRHYVELQTAYEFKSAINKNTYFYPILKQDKSCLHHVLRNMFEKTPITQY